MKTRLGQVSDGEGEGEDEWEGQGEVQDDDKGGEGEARSCGPIAAFVRRSSAAVSNGCAPGKRGPEEEVYKCSGWKT